MQRVRMRMQFAIDAIRLVACTASINLAFETRSVQSRLLSSGKVSNFQPYTIRLKREGLATKYVPSVFPRGVNPSPT